MTARQKYKKFFGILATQTPKALILAPKLGNSNLFGSPSLLPAV
jgi:hypothetical protein